MQFPRIDGARIWALLTAVAALLLSCSDTNPEFLTFGGEGGAGGEDGGAGEGGDAAHDLCAPECLLFCGTKEECTSSSSSSSGAPAR